ncbi:STAS domain-containing protein [Mycolicibacterium holsaticum]|uniref:STAS domain-containing protein n=1 Tax=Mycolicibacterium holsaticum TaxID=152142 RepID=UPI001C7E1368|nr:STAS domain-containing protein [Mycolicibacterium holsaticum]MDA4108983.1 anti-sigma factor antagonist [Mycolicibacterium holsaticum DSM 44478 = JCM 12374]QZA11400.1 STAS domain-containing protein [Mycolicibacterium holsaticum DSM 44478 = JCM 12374]UNC11107.1 STAS domain-containing protein [Mycolicibacterium holsaticum DSM 44478 = JCM 12374]
MSSVSTFPESATDSTFCRTARFTTRWLKPDIAVVSAHGEIDAANAREFINYALRHAGRIKRLVLDLSGVEFFGTAGFSALHTFNVRCVGDQIDWALASSAGVARVLQICDPDWALPTYDSVDAALSAVQDDSRPLLQLIPKPR